MSRAMLATLLRKNSRSLFRNRKLALFGNFQFRSRVVTAENRFSRTIYVGLRGTMFKPPSPGR